jgi:exosortase E/protease (VPEID-CTERM system)
LRIAALIWIGHSGAAEIALGGFHSQAGWISFNVVSLGIFAWARTSAVFGVVEAHPAEGNSSGEVQTDPSPYLMPFLTILGVGMLVRAVSGSFEWLYPVKPLAAGLVLWHYRAYYRRALDWTFGWTGVLAGLAVLVIWVAPEFWTSVAEPGRPAALGGVHPLWGWTWIAARVIGAVVTVPMAEELAFRGFLLRRFTSSDVDSVVPDRSMWPGIAVSSLVFGFLHGERWLTGILAGLIYAGVYVRTGRIGEAVLAHSVTNGLLVLLVLFFGTWRYW